MTEIFNSDSERCDISKYCVRLMTSRGLTGYPITHQLLWSVLVEDRPKCVAAVQPYLRRYDVLDIASFQLELCTNNFFEMVAVVEVLMNGSVHESHQDLFLEQQFVCPSLGFYEFLKKAYLHQILSWQFPVGCFGEQDSDFDEELGKNMDFASLLEEYNGDKLQFLPGGKNLPQDENAVIEKAFSRKLPFQGAEKKHVNLAGTDSPSAHNLSMQGKSRLSANNRHAGSILRPQQHQSKKRSGEQNSIVSHFNSQRENVNRAQVAKKGGEYASKNGGPEDVLSHKYALKAADMIGQRRLLVEKKMTGGCLSHKTGVAAGALVIYLRYLIDPGKIKWRGQHDLLLADTGDLPQAKANDESNMDDEEEEEKEEEEEEGEYEDEVTDPTLETTSAVQEEEEEAGNKDDETDYVVEDENEEEEEEEEEVVDDDFPQQEETKRKSEYDENWQGEALGGWLVEKESEDGEKAENQVGKDTDQRDSKKFASRNVNFLPFEDGAPGASLGKALLTNNQDLDKHIDLEVQKSSNSDPNFANNQEKEEENYYDDDDDEIEPRREVVVKKIKQPIIVAPPVLNKFNKKSRSSGLIAFKGVPEDSGEELASEQPNYTMVTVISIAPFFILIFFLFKFVRRRRVHIRYRF
ncbi:upf0764 protein c16orf89 homolog [Plakobranchus ocellatus]|uniref:Upf0764 protein c16orf89 homolog n=1 Tax=Plakobranchus ocellatus TaxID=259542 RepID=A0AAV4B5Y6_9GAST|nr:upf0764 protein c16orf89 homolog [Plakobranchus ocellatus]